MKPYATVYIATIDDNIPVVVAKTKAELKLMLDDYCGATEEYNFTGKFLGYTPHETKYPSDLDGYYEYDCKYVSDPTDDRTYKEKFKIFTVDFSDK